MRQLMILRHASATRAGPHIADHARPLDESGRAEVTRMSQVFRRLSLVPELILVSSARRTLETLERLEPWQATPLVRQRNAFYLASASTLLEVLHETEDRFTRVLMVGHNPGLQELVRHLAGPAKRLPGGFPTAGLAVYGLEGSWRDLRSDNCTLTGFHQADAP